MRSTEIIIISILISILINYLLIINTKGKKVTNSILQQSGL